MYVQTTHAGQCLLEYRVTHSILYCQLVSKSTVIPRMTDQDILLSKKNKQ